MTERLKDRKKPREEHLQSSTAEKKVSLTFRLKTSNLKELIERGPTTIDVYCKNRHFNLFTCLCF